MLYGDMCLSLYGAKVRKGAKTVIVDCCGVVFGAVECKTAPNLLLRVVPFKVLKRWSLVLGYYLLASFESVSFASVEL